MIMTMARKRILRRSSDTFYIKESGLSNLYTYGRLLHCCSECCISSCEIIELNLKDFLIQIIFLAINSDKLLVVLLLVPSHDTVSSAYPASPSALLALPENPESKDYHGCLDEPSHCFHQSVDETR